MRPDAILQILQTHLPGKKLAPAPVYAGDPHAGLMVGHRGVAKYRFDEEGRLTGLNLAFCDMTDAVWQNLLRDLGAAAHALIDLNLSDNRLTRFDFGPALGRLEHVNLSRNPKLKQIAFSAPLPALERLVLSECALTDLSLPAGMQRLYWLEARRNKLKRLSFDGQFPALEWLDLSENELTDLRIPKGLGRLGHLYLNKNQLSGLRFETPLRLLRTLHLRGNRLNALPDNLLSCTALETLYLHGNAWQGNLASVVPEGESANAFVPVRDYLRELQKGHIANDRVKVIIVGNGRVGKTSMFRRLKGLPFRKDEKFTHGVQLGDLSKEELPAVKTPGLQANVWDFGGQEIFYATHQFFLTDNAVYVLAWTAEENVALYRERDKATLPTNEKWRPREYWLDNIRRRAPNSPLLIVQTHCNGKREPYDQTEYTREPLRAECLEFDAANDEGLDRLKRLLTERLNADIPHFGENFPETYDRVIGEVERQRWEKNKISREQFDAICSTAGITPGAETSVLEFLRVTGSVVWFPDVKALKNTIFINPNWLTQQVYRLINNDLHAAKGRMDAAYIARILDDYSEEERMQFLELLENFELIFQPKDEALYIAPQYLDDELEPEVRNAYEIILDDLKPAFTFRFPKFVPENIMINFLSRYGPFSRKLYWKNGICFRTADRGNCIVTFDETAGSLTVYTLPDSPGSHSLQAEVCKAFVELGRNARAEIALAGHPFVSWQELVDAEKDGINKIRAVDGSPVEVEDYDRFFEWEMPRAEAKPVQLKEEPTAALRTIRIFLASSNELVDDRREFEIFINRENKTLVKQGLFLELIQWEDFLDAVSTTRLQDEYNKAIRECDILVSLFFTKVGQFTAEEFDIALGQFRETGKPHIFTYFKDAPINIGAITDEIQTLLQFKKRLEEIGHFFTSYASSSDLKLHFSGQLKKLKVL